MRLMVDTNVFIKFEKSGKPIDFSSWDSSQKVYISVVTVSELLKEVHGADSVARRQRRSVFVGAVARCHDLALLTDIVKEFSRVPGLHVIPFGR